jgi:hypothetical protein
MSNHSGLTYSLPVTNKHTTVATHQLPLLNRMTYSAWKTCPTALRVRVIRDRWFGTVSIVTGIPPAWFVHSSWLLVRLPDRTVPETYLTSCGSAFHAGKYLIELVSRTTDQSVKLSVLVTADSYLAGCKSHIIMMVRETTANAPPRIALSIDLPHACQCQKHILVQCHFTNSTRVLKPGL